MLEKLGKYEGRRKTRFLKKKKKKKRNDGDENRWERVDYSIFLFFFLCIRGRECPVRDLGGGRKVAGEELKTRERWGIGFSRGGRKNFIRYVRGEGVASNGMREG